MLDLRATSLRNGPSPVGRGPLGLEGAAREAGKSEGLWRSRYVRRAVLADALCAAAAAGVGYQVRFGSPDVTRAHGMYWVALVLPVVWLGAVLLARGYEPRFLFIGAEEFRRTFFAGMVLLATVGTVSWAFKLEVARGFVVITLPLLTGLTLVQRYAHRQWLHRGRSRGLFQQTTLLVGHRNAVTALHAQLERQAYHGYRVIGCCLPQAQQNFASETLRRLPVLGDLEDVPAVVRQLGIGAVAVLPCPEFDGAGLRRLGWALEKTDAELLLAPAITEIVGPRVRIRPVSGLPLMHMERPELRGIRRFAKDVFDRTVAGAGLLLLAPALVAIALAVRLSGPGPVLFRQERVGRDGETFDMLKFRSMAPGAEQMVSGLTADGNGVLFKKRQDPRVTAVGRVLRRYSLDELPQLFNVVRGEMSLVGPRPPLPSEVEQYGYDMHRRFLVKPGLTGLWQVSGRSDLSWDDSVRMDLRYVESWSLTFDLMILWKTVRAVWRGEGAY